MAVCCILLSRDIIMYYSEKNGKAKLQSHLLRRTLKLTKAALPAFALVLLLSGICTQALAHPQPVDYTLVESVVRQGSVDSEGATAHDIQVSHRFHLHELFSAKNRKACNPGSEAGLQAFAEAVHQEFLIADRHGELLPGTLLGFERDGANLWVYREFENAPQNVVLTLGRIACLHRDHSSFVSVQKRSETNTQKIADIELQAGESVLVDFHRKD